MILPGRAVQSISDTHPDFDFILSQFLINILNNICIEFYSYQSRLKGGGVPWGMFRFLAVMLTTSSLGLGSGCQCAYRVADDITSILAS
jgi:hypothetical protein